MVTCFQNRWALLSVHLSLLFLLFIPLTFSAFWLLPTAFSEDDSYLPKTTYRKREPNMLKEKTSFLAFSQGYQTLSWLPHTPEPQSLAFGRCLPSLPPLRMYAT